MHENEISQGVSSTKMLTCLVPEEMMVSFQILGHFLKVFRLSTRRHTISLVTADVMAEIQVSAGFIGTMFQREIKAFLFCVQQLSLFLFIGGNSSGDSGYDTSVSTGVE